MNSASVLRFIRNFTCFVNWHGDCINLSKSDTLISFLLKKVYFVPQSGPFSISAFPQTLFKHYLGR